MRRSAVRRARRLRRRAIVALWRLILTYLYKHDVLSDFYNVGKRYKHVGLRKPETFTTRHVKALDFALGKQERHIAHPS